MKDYGNRSIDLSPAKWIWPASERTLPNTFVKFRRDITVSGNVKSATGYILAQSRYLLKLNGERVQSGPAPSDPRYEEADTLSLNLKIGENRIDILVCYFGHGDGTWVAGRPGLIFKIKIEYQNGDSELIVSDRNTLSCFDKSRPAGQYKRWFLRALQEEYDARRENSDYIPSMELPGKADKPSSLNGYNDYLFDSSAADSEKTCIRKRKIPISFEEKIIGSVYHSGTLKWKKDSDEWFKFRVPDAFEISEGLKIEEDGSFFIENDAAYVTYVMPEQGVGYIDFEIIAPEGTIIEAIVQESHDKAKTLWLDSYYYCWTRFICKEGYNHFTGFDIESFMYLQLHIHGASGKIFLKNAGMIRKTYPIAQKIIPKTDREKLQKVIDASVNTLKNSAIEIFSDGMGRERQQYAGDGSHQVTAFSYLYGADDPIVERFFETFGDGMTNEGFYMDCWPAYDRCLRISQSQLGITLWPPILDHSLQFIIECYRNFLFTGNDYIIRKSYKDFIKFYCYMLSLRDNDGLIKVENLGTASVWIDHLTYRKQRDKKCVFNLYFIGTVQTALEPVCRYFGDDAIALKMENEAAGLLKRVKKLYYDSDSGLFTDNLPFRSEDGYTSLSDRTISTAVVFGFDRGEKAHEILKEYPEYLSKSYPANMPWVYRALGIFGEADTVTDDLENRWFNMMSVQKNNTLQEDFSAVTDSNSEMSHCPLAPLIVIYENYLGLRCEEAGFKKFSVKPNFGKIKEMTVPLMTACGKVIFVYKNGKLDINTPDGVNGYIRK